MRYVAVVLMIDKPGLTSFINFLLPLVFTGISYSVQGVFVGKDFNITEATDTGPSPSARFTECSSEDVEAQKRRLSEVRKVPVAFLRL